ncbi:HpcH/HpaI aldolase/citrate lyase family protein [Hydrogenophaga laconesensis]|uniref:Citrate lyase subunit beta/citryl-CoA lyase n=1 Tax=Hydrogenophaga laconesensis TaxID=1805971 RepID=A0ABU1V6U4_9BURK|nr:CoA ester lyase [Hydrogenophaga laconesensis]MDR7093110.1 citrate lyase subunit beta/citryl-CoA lyase [Hydrogenophaga laconesensis]
MGEQDPIWRSMLFVPAHVERFVERAHARGADACVLDLEDSVPLAQKAQARAAVPGAAAAIAGRGTPVLVRVNQPSALAIPDIEAVVGPDVRGLVLPKVNDAAMVHEVVHRIDRVEAQKGLRQGHTRLLALIEDVQALPALDDIARSTPRMLGMMLGPEDFSVSAGMAPVRDALMLPNQLVLFACRRAGILPFGFPGSIADYGDADAFAQTIRLARQLGFVGGLCIHPTQVAVMNAGFSPSAEDIEHARGVIDAFENAEREGRGAAEYRSKMVDLPVVVRAREILRRIATAPLSTPQETNP